MPCGGEAHRLHLPSVPDAVNKVDRGEWMRQRPGSMKRPTLLTALLLMLAALRAADAQDVLKWSLGGSQPSGYVMTADGSPMTGAGATLTLRSTASTVSDIGTVTSTMRVDTLSGRRLRISADIETREVSTSASVWLRADSAGKMLALDNGMDQAIKGTTTASRHMDVTLFVPRSATTLVFGLLLSGTGEATARNVRIVARPVVPANTPLPPEAQRELDSAFAIVRRGSLWRDTVTWSRVEPEVRAIAAGSETAADTHAAIRALLARLGDHHSFLMKPQGAAAFRTGGAENPRPLVRVQTDGIGYISVPAYSGIDKAAAESYVRAVHDSLARAVTNGAGTCRWILDLRANGGGNMWPMLAGLRPFVGEEGLGSFVSATGSDPLWHARDEVDVKPPADPCTVGVGECRGSDRSTDCKFRGGGHHFVHWPAAYSDVRLADCGTVYGERHDDAARQRDDTVDDGRRGGSNGKAIWGEAHAG
jgi:carboxyl-terminal processing protease